ncbi:MAG TPA: hypothetical protein PK690_09035 [Emcibacteraceae bacterium]|nr:hypothetical protein [Emcibacteraceae bacterium]
MQLQTQISGITHPLIKNMFLKRSFSNDDRISNVLVIDTLGHINSNTVSESLGLFDLLTDLPAIRHQIEEKFGHFDAVDIRQH